MVHRLQVAVPLTLSPVSSKSRLLGWNAIAEMRRVCSRATLTHTAQEDGVLRCNARFLASRRVARASSDWIMCLQAMQTVGS